MKYTVQQLAKLAGVSVRALHHYDAIGLLHASRNESNKYRVYGERELYKLQQIMFFRELEFPLEEIRKILEDPSFDLLSALEEHKKLIEIKKKRMAQLIRTIEKTIRRVTKEKSMQDEELYEGFNKEEMEAWEKEAKEKWGHTKAYKESVERYNSLSAQEKKDVLKRGDEIMEDIAKAINNNESPESEAVQNLVQRHYEHLSAFYEPNLEMYRNMADMFAGYTGDERYKAYFEKFHKNLPEFMREAIHAYCAKHQ